MIGKFDKYRLIRKLATGGMADIYLAEYVSIKGFRKKLVIKKILPKLMMDDKFIDMFIDEANIAVNFNHRNIVQVFDFGKVDEEYYIAMEYVDGFDLFQIFKFFHFNKSEINESLVLFILMEILKGLSYAHNKTENEQYPLIHRDISLNNIIISKNGDVKILDFGIAKAGKSGDVISGKDLKGKLSYMAPEQLLRKDLDARVDIYSVGILAWRLLTGEKPFELSDYKRKEDLVNVVIPELNMVNTRISKELSDIIMRALKKDRNERYSSASEFYKTLYNYIMRNSNLRVMNHFVFAEYIKKHIDDLVDREVDEKTDPQSKKTRTEFSYVDFTSAFNELQSNEKKNVNLVYCDFKKLYKVYEDSSLDMINYLTTTFFKLISNMAYKYQAPILFLDQHAMAFIVGAIVTKEEDLVNSVRFAIEIDEALKSFLKDYNFPLELSIVVNRGKVIVNKINKNMKIKLLPVDNLLKKTRRLAEDTNNGIMITPEIKDNLFRYFELKEHNNLFEVIKFKRVKSKSSVSKVPFIGREKELLFLKESLSKTLKLKKSSFNYIIGDAGIGKTRLSRKLLEHMRANYKNFYFIKGRALISENEPFAIFKDLLKNFLNLTTKDKFEYKMNFFLGNLESNKKREIISLLGYFLGLDYVNDKYIQGLKEDSNHIISLQLTNLKNLLRLLLKDKPIVLFLENIHLVSNVGLNFLNEIINQFSDLPLYLLATSRDSILAKIEINEKISVINLKGLTYDYSLRLMLKNFEEGLALPRKLRTPNRLSDLIYQKSSGNPFFIEELVKIFKEKEIVYIENNNIYFNEENFNLLDIPSSLEAILQAKFDTLTIEEKHLLHRASIFGGKFWLDPLSKMLDKDITETLSNLEKKGFLYKRTVPSLTLKVEYIFKQTLLRDIIYESLINKVKKDYHLKLATILEAYKKDKLNRLIAFHYEKSDKYEDALKYYLLAAQRAEKFFVLNEAVILYEKYLEIYKKEEIDWEHYFDIKISISSLYQRLTKFNDSEKVLKDIYKTIENLELSDHVYFKLNEAFYDFYFLKEDYARALLYINIAKSFSFNKEEYYNALYKESWVFYKKNQIKKALKGVEDVINNIQYCLNEALVYSLYASILSESGNYIKALEYSQIVINRNIKSENWRKVIINLSNIGEIYREHGDLKKAQDYYFRAVELSKEKPTTDYLRALLSNNLGALELANGNYTKAIDLLENTIKLLKEINIYAFRYETHRLLAEVYMKTNKPEKAFEEAKIAEKFALTAQNTQNLVMIYLIMGEYHLKKENNSDVEFFLLKSLSLATSYVDKKIVYERMIDFYTRINPKKANEYKNKLSKLIRVFKQKNSNLGV